MSTLVVTSLAEREAVIERGLGTFVEVGAALMGIRDDRQYRESHDTFEDYCRERWGLSKPYASQLIVASQTVAIATVEDRPAPASESVARELAPLRAEPEQLREAWTEALEQHGPSPTAVQVREVVRERRPDHVAQALKRIEPCDNRFEYVNQCAIWLRDLPDPEDLPLPPDEGNQQRLSESIRFLAEWAPRMALAWKHRAPSEEA